MSFSLYNLFVLKRIIIGIVLNAGALYAVIYFMDKDITYTGGIAFFAVGGIVMGILNSIVKPILKLLTLPLHIITVGLSLILLNGVIFWIFAVTIDTLAIEGISLQVTDFITYAFAGAIFGVINWVENLIVSPLKT